ncbi:MAG: glycosyl transferase family protein [Candidatus Berkelbacteria bacterium Gr01-1014_85]|uniref:Polyprenol-phosphate-mannose--protein mannosyltransferase n=1 Tax=Candidatus Berkelbacteria bacterium Gr01-1014_85 TaxID=2017150 RepID=A0A554JDV9_9BACT|nr:MAG: glycosyl transferase family protein [Candidatus Berkelbacteria bacterium Gr01-1014_85]
MSIKSSYLALVLSLCLGLGFIVVNAKLAQSDSVTTDEIAHLSASLSYVQKQDNRLNPEHPPLLKIMAGLAGQPLQPRVDYQSAAWTELVNGQWDLGGDILFANGNDAQRLLTAMRWPTIILGFALACLGFIYFWKRKQPWAAALFTLLTLASPSIIAHSHLITFDIGAAFWLLATLFSLDLLGQQGESSRSRIWWLSLAGVTLGLALTSKFSLVYLLPITLVVWLWQWRRTLSWRWMLGYYLLAFITIMIIYSYVTWNYPFDRFQSDWQSITGGFYSPDATQQGLIQWIQGFDRSTIFNSTTKPFFAYVLGLAMTLTRIAGGHTGYFLGNLNHSGSALYFPILLITKESLSTLALIAIGSILTLKQWQKLSKLTQSVSLTIAAYWLLALVSPLNIGYRHILPTLPLIYLVITESLCLWQAHGLVRLRPLKLTLIIALAVTTLGVAVASYPFYLPFYNSLVGGREQGYKVASDSNYDWGQDIARLGHYLKEQNIEQLTWINYRQREARYYIGPFVEAYIPGQKLSGYFAISGGELIASGYPLPDNKELVTQIGSIFLFYAP